MVVKLADRQRKEYVQVLKNRLNRQCTWLSLNWAAKNEIDCIMSDKPYIFLDVSVIICLNMDSDHRIRA